MSNSLVREASKVNLESASAFWSNQIEAQNKTIAILEKENERLRKVTDYLFTHNEDLIKRNIYLEDKGRKAKEMIQELDNMIKTVTETSLNMPSLEDVEADSDATITDDESSSQESYGEEYDEIFWEEYENCLIKQYPKDLPQQKGVLKFDTFEEAKEHAEGLYEKGHDIGGITFNKKHYCIRCSNIGMYKAIQEKDMGCKSWVAPWINIELRKKNTEDARDSYKLNLI